MIAHFNSTMELEEFIAKHLFERIPFYLKAKHHISTDDQTIEDLVFRSVGFNLNKPSSSPNVTSICSLIEVDREIPLKSPLQESFYDFDLLIQLFVVF